MSPAGGDGCEQTLRPFSCRGIRTSGVVGSQWLGLGWRAGVAFSFFEMSQDFSNNLLLGRIGFIMPPFLQPRNFESFGVAPGC